MTTLIVYIVCGTLLFFIVRREYLKERAEYESQNGLSKNQVYKASKYMRDDLTRQSFQEMFKNLSKN